MLGLYELLDRLTKKFPDVLFEGCASGGGRYGGDFQCRFWHFRAAAEDTHSAKAAARTNSNVGKGESEQ